MTVDLSLMPLLTDFSFSHRDNPTSRHGVFKQKMQWLLLNDIFFGHSLAALLWARQVEEVLLELGWEKYKMGGLFVHRKQGLFLSIYVDDIKMAGKQQHMAPMRKKLMKNVDLDEPTSFLDHVYLGCTQREC